MIPPQSRLTSAHVIALLGFLLAGAAFVSVFEQPVYSSQSRSASTYLIRTSTVSGTKYYYAYNANSALVYGGTAGLGSTDGANFTSVIQAAINSVGCGSIYLSAQVFNMTHGLTTYPCISISGVAGNADFGIEPNTTLISSTDCNHPVITVEVRPGSSFVVFPALSRFGMVGKGTCGTGQDGIFYTNVNGVMLDAYITYVRIYGMGGNCLNLSTTNMKLWIDNTYFEDCNQNGISGQANIFISSSYIFGNLLYGINHVSGGILNSFHDWFLNNVQSGLFCANLNNQCNSQDDTVQNNGGASFAQMTISTSASPTANPTVIQGDTFTDSRTSGQAFAQIRMGATQVYANIQTNSFWSAKNVPCFSFIGGGYITGGSLPNVIINGNQGQCANVVGKVTGNIFIGGTSTKITHFTGAFGMNSTTPIASQEYVDANTENFITCSGGANVNIQIYDPLVNVIETIGACPSTYIDVPIGWGINFGAFTVTPTVTEYVKNI